MKILITGAGGFLGQHTAKLLLAKGHEVYNFSRSNHPALTALGVESFCGDLQNYDDVLKAVSNVDAVFHMASKVGMWGNYADYYAVNVVGTQNIIKSCQESGVEKLVYTSTPSVVFGKDDLINADETQPYPTAYLTHYAQTKSIAEQELLAANSSNLFTVALRPHLIFGPGDPHLIPRLIEKTRQGKLRQVGDGTNLVDIIYVENAAAAHVQAFEHLGTGSKVNGNAYFIAQEKPVQLWSFIGDILAGSDLSLTKRPISAGVAYGLGAVIEGVFKVFGLKNEPPMTRFISLQLSKSHYFSHAKAKSDFNYSPEINVEEAVRRTIGSNNAI